MLHSKEISDELSLKIITYIQKSQPELYWDYRAELNKEQIEEILKTGSAHTLVESIYDNNFDYINYLEQDLIIDVIDTFYDELIAEKLVPEDELGDECANKRYLKDKMEDDIKDYIEVDLNIEKLIDNTDACFNIETEIDHCFSGYSMSVGSIIYRDVEDELSFFNINPRAVAEQYGKDKRSWPDIKERNGNELVDPELLFVEWDNHSTEWGSIVIPIKIKLSDIVHEDKFKNDIVIKKGARVWIHDNINGACSPGEAPTQKDLILKKGTFKIVLDGSNGYGLDHICGLHKPSVWDTEIKSIA